MFTQAKTRLPLNLQKADGVRHVIQVKQQVTKTETVIRYPEKGRKVES